MVLAEEVDLGGRGGFDRRPREMHKATCGDCGKIVKFHSSQNRTSQSTAANAFKVIKN